MIDPDSRGQDLEDKKKIAADSYYADRISITEPLSSSDGNPDLHATRLSSHGNRDALNVLDGKHERIRADEIAQIGGAHARKAPFGWPMRLRRAARLDP
jgi:hypothetical protein